MVVNLRMSMKREKCNDNKLIENEDKRQEELDKLNATQDEWKLLPWELR